MSIQLEGPGTPAAEERPESHQNGAPPVYVSSAIPVSPQYLPGGKKSLSAIAGRAFGLGIALGGAAVISLLLVLRDEPLWRAPFFIATLAVFHYLEFDMTARYNPPDAKVSSFLLSANGSAYNVAHTAAMLELLVRRWLCSPYRPGWLSLPFTVPRIFPAIPSTVPLAFGMAFIVVGQSVRSSAMATAGTSFNHLVQSVKREDHVLVTSGVYAYLRHPSYFGFFWWGLGTQLALGNHVCFVGYAVVLWNFFSTRIMSTYRRRSRKGVEKGHN